MTKKTKKLPREVCLDTARKIISADREKQYSGPEDSFAQIAEYWNAYLTRRIYVTNDGRRVVKLRSDDVAVMMCLLKLARLATGGTNQPDTWIDVAGYAGCGFEVSTTHERHTVIP